MYLPVFVGVVALICVWGAWWEFRRKGQHAAARVWQVAVWVLTPLAVVVIALGVSGHHLADDAQVVLAVGVVLLTLAASMEQWRSGRRSR